MSETAGVGDIDAVGFEQLPGTEHAVDIQPAIEVPTPVEAVNHPAHYGGADNPYEAIKVIEAWDLGFCLGNTVKYISRAGKKGPVAHGPDWVKQEPVRHAQHIQDLEKARWYLQRHIDNLKERA